MLQKQFYHNNNPQNIESQKIKFDSLFIFKRTQYNKMKIFYYTKYAKLITLKFNLSYFLLNLETTINFKYLSHYNNTITRRYFMINNHEIIELLYNKLDLKINKSELISESYILIKEELDSKLLPKNFYDIMNAVSYRVLFFYYRDITIYVFCNLEMTEKFLTGILKQERLVFSKYE